MDIQRYIDNLREKPEHIRKRYAFAGAFSITAVIFVFWIASFTTLGATSKAAVVASVSMVASPGQTLIASVGSFFVDIKDMIFGAKTITYSEVEVVPGSK